MKDLSSFMEIGMGERMKKASAEISQFTTHLRPCFGIGVYNLDNDESYMGHYTDLFFYDFEEDIKMIANDFNNSNLNVFGTGGALEEGQEKYNKGVMRDRIKIERILKKYFSEVNLEWNDSENPLNLYLDKEKRQFIVLPERN